MEKGKTIYNKRKTENDAREAGKKTSWKQRDERHLNLNHLAFAYLFFLPRFSSCHFGCFYLDTFTSKNVINSYMIFLSFFSQCSGRNLQWQGSTQTSSFIFLCHFHDNFLLVRSKEKSCLSFKSLNSNSVFLHLIQLRSKIHEVPC